MYPTRIFLIYILNKASSLRQWPKFHICNFYFQCGDMWVWIYNLYFLHMWTFLIQPTMLRFCDDLELDLYISLFMSFVAYCFIIYD